MKKLSNIIFTAAAALAVCGCQNELEIDAPGSGISFNPTVEGIGTTQVTKASDLCSADGSVAIPLWLKVSDGISIGEIAGHARNDGNDGDRHAELDSASDSASAPATPATKGELLNPDPNPGGTGTKPDKPLSNYATVIGGKFYVSGWNSTSGTAKRFVPSSGSGYAEISYNSSTSAWSTCTSDEWKGEDARTFYAYANLPSSTSVASIANADASTQTLTYTAVPAAASSQKDILMGFYTGKGTPNTTDKTCTAPVVFHHPLTAVKFVKGDFDGFSSIKFKAIYLSQVYKSGTATMTPTSIVATDPDDRFTWTNLSSDMQEAIQESSTDLLNTTTNVIGEPFIIIPQNLADKPVTITVVVELDGVVNALTTTCNTGSWKAGYTNTYTLSKDGYEWDYTFEFSEEPSPEVAARSIDDNKETSKTKTVSVTSYKTREDDPGNPVNVSWKILSYKLEGESSAVTVNDTEFTDTETGMTVTAGTDGISVTAAARDKVGKGTNDYWTRTSPSEDAGWSPADWSSTATWSNPIDLSKYNYTKDTYTALSGMTTANCYVIRHAGTYKLPLVYGNAMNGGNVNELSYYPNADGSMTTGTDALTNGDIEDITDHEDTYKVRLVRFQNHLGNGITDPFIENNAGCVAEDGVILWQSDGDVVKELQLVGDPQTAGSYTKDNVRYIQFKVDQNTVCQNVTLIALRNASGTVMWSWQIWTTNDPALTQGSIEVKNFENKSSKFFPVPNIGFIEGWTYMPRKSMEITLQQDGGRTITLNVEQPQIEQQPFNALYQFGRKDPTCSKEDVYYFNSSILEKPISTYGPVAPGEPGEVTLASYIQNPCTFYMFNLVPKVNYGLTMSYPYRNLWSGKNCYEGAQNQDASHIKTVYDPSPIGYKVPAGKAFTGFSMTGDNLFGTIDPFSPEKVNGYYDHSGNAYFYTVPGVGHTTTGGETIRFTCTGIRAGGSGRVNSRQEGWYYSDNVSYKWATNADGREVSKPFLFNFKFANGFTDMDELRPLTEAGHNAHGLRPVIDPTMPNNPMQ